MLKVIAASFLGKKPSISAEAPKHVLARHEIESLFQDDLAIRVLVKKSARVPASPLHA